LKALRRLSEFETARFLASGAVAAAANIASRFAFRLFCSFQASVVLAFAVGTVVSFLLNRDYTFRARGEPARVQAPRFALIALVGIPLAGWLAQEALTALESIGAGSAMGKPAEEAAAHVFALAAVTVYNYLAMKYFSFRRAGFWTASG
jgi:putative flippase GtrA